MKLIAIVAAFVCLLAACGPHATAQSPARPSSRPSPTSTPSTNPAPTAYHVFLIVMENRSFKQVIDSPYISLLAAKYGVATNYHSVSSPSLPNYLALTSGDTWGIRDNEYHRLPAGGLGAQLADAGIDWRAYMEGMAGGCFDTTPLYALKHNPFAYYGGTCPPQVVPFTTFATDISGNVPRFVWITPDMCHDGHDCNIAVADDWLSQTVPIILSSAAWKDNGLLLITWDEGAGADDQILTLVIRPKSGARTSDHPYDHYSLLATIEDQLGVARLGQAAQASALDDLLTD